MYWYVGLILFKQTILNSFCIDSSNIFSKVIAFGNALVSYTAYLKDTKLLDRYKLSMNTKSEIDDETLSAVTAEVIVNK